MQKAIHRRGAIYRAQHILSLFLRKYGTVMRISIASNLAYVMEVVFRSLFLIALIFVFGQLWRTTYSARGIQLLSGFSVSDMIWYLVATHSHTWDISRVRAKRLFPRPPGVDMR